MLRQNGSMELNFIPGKIRKRWCSSSASSSSSSSSVVNNYRFKRAILVGKRRGSSTPVPTWKLVSLRAMESPKSHTGGGKQGPVSARKLAATLWEMNEVPYSPRVKERRDDTTTRLKKELRARERSMLSESLLPHLSDPSRSPVSERMDRSGTGCFHRRTPSTSNRLRLTEYHVGPLDSLSNAGLMVVSNTKIVTRSRAQSPASSLIGVKKRLKDVSNALTASKELLKIINRVWGNEDRPSSSLSLISALHTELERARLQVNQLIQEQRSDHHEMSYLMKCFAEEKAAWKRKEQEIVEAAIEPVAEELDIERKLRRQFESLNKKLAGELAESKASLLKMVKELESEKRAREIIEQVCDELARDAEDKYELEKQGRESAEVYEEIEKEKEMIQLADMLLEKRAQIKLSAEKYQLEEKTAAVDKLRNQLETLLGNKQVREEGHGSSHLNNEEIAAYLCRTRFGSHHNKDKEDGDGVECEDDSAESDLHSIELNVDNKKRYKQGHPHPSESRCATRRYPTEEEAKGRRHPSGRVSRRSTSLHRSISDGIEWGIQAEKVQKSGDGIGIYWESFSKQEKQAHGKDCCHELQGYKSVKGLRDQILAGSGLVSSRVDASPTRQFSEPWPSRDLTITNTFQGQERHDTVQGNGIKSRLAEGQNVRKFKR